MTLPRQRQDDGATAGAGDGDYRFFFAHRA
jgi:hypothetical protein